MPTRLALLIAPTLAALAAAACSGVSVTVSDPIDDGGETDERDSDAGARPDAGDAGKKGDASRDAGAKTDAKGDCPPANADVCGLPCWTPGLVCPSTGFLQCTKEPSGRVIWLCAASGL